MINWLVKALSKDKINSQNKIKATVVSRIIHIGIFFGVTILILGQLTRYFGELLTWLDYISISVFIIFAFL